MGRIEDLAKERGHRSLRAVAFAMREGEDSLWPRGDDRSPETVANKLRAIDKGEDPDWWLRGAGATLLPALAHVLHDDVGTIQSVIAEAGSGSNAPAITRFEFSMFPALRPLDLLDEDPFPGVPDDLLTPGGPKWDHVWWVAPRGAGKSLVGRWLEARYGWSHVQAATWPEAVGKLPRTGNVFLELRNAEGATAEVLEKGRRLCVASSAEPPEPPEPSKQDDTSGTGEEAFARARERPTSKGGVRATVRQSPWVTRRTGRAHTWRKPLVDWVAERVARGGGFDRSGVSRLLDLLGESLFQSPGELLDFLGVVDFKGSDGLEGDSMDDLVGWIRVWLRASLQRAGGAEVAKLRDYLRRDGARLLLDIERARLRDGFGPVLPAKRWAQLVPEELGVQPTAEEVLELAAELGVKKARERLKLQVAACRPELVSALVQLGALEDVRGELQLAPAWLASFVEHMAFESLFADVPLGVGALLLHSETSKAALDRVLQLADEERFDELSRCFGGTEGSPEEAAAVEGAFRAVGFKLASGTAVPVDLLQAAWEAQLPSLVTRYTNWPPSPMISVREQDFWSGTTSMGLWFLAAISIAGALREVESVVIPAALNPWSEPETDAVATAHREALSRVAAAGRETRSRDSSEGLEEIRLAGERLGGQLLDARGVLKQLGHVADIQVPDVLVRLAQGHDFGLDDKQVETLLGLPGGLNGLRAACERRGVEVSVVLGWCWKQWVRAPGKYPPIHWAYERRSPRRSGFVAELWEALPEELVSKELADAVEQSPGTWPHVPLSLWKVWLENWDSRSRGEARMFEYLPQELIRGALEDGKLDPWAHDARRVLWGRMPEHLITLIDELILEPAVPHTKLASHGGAVADLVWSAPEPHQSRLVSRAAEWLGVPERYRGAGNWVVRWLIQVVSDRAEAWRDAFGLLVEYRHMLQ